MKKMIDCPGFTDSAGSSSTETGATDTGAAAGGAAAAGSSGLVEHTFEEGSLGIQLTKREGDGRALVDGVVAEGQGESLGVKKGDVLTSIEGKPMSYDMAMKFLVLRTKREATAVRAIGAKAPPVKLTFERP